MSDTRTFSTGAVRSSDADSTRYDLVPLAGLRRIAEAAAHGAEKYTPYNWQKGMPLSVLINHALKHIYQYLDGDKSEDHLGHANWNLSAACEMEEKRPDMIDIPTRALPTLREQIKASHADIDTGRLHDHEAVKAEMIAPAEAVTDVWPPAWRTAT